MKANGAAERNTQADGKGGERLRMSSPRTEPRAEKERGRVGGFSNCPDSWDPGRFTARLPLPKAPRGYSCFLGHRVRAPAMYVHFRKTWPNFLVRFQEKHKSANTTTGPREDSQEKERKESQTLPATERNRLLGALGSSLCPLCGLWQVPH